jgi:trypsin-like peptidase
VLRLTCPILVIILSATSLTAQTGAPKVAIEMDAEANDVLSAAQKQIRNLPGPAQGQVLSGLRTKIDTPNLKTLGIKAPSDILAIDPEKLSFRQKDQILGNIMQQQRFVDPGSVVTPSNSGNPQDIVPAFTASSPLTPEEIKRYSDNARKIPTLAQSVGRLLWSDKASRMWHFEGTVFVTKTNIVATACHAVEHIVDVKNEQLVLRSDRVAVVEFSDGELPDTGMLPTNVQTYPVIGIAASGSTLGCDVAFLRIDGALTIPSLKVSNGKSIPKRIALIGYPQLTDLTPLVCQYAVDDTTKYFCKFHAAHPGIAKVKSPGTVYTSNLHNGINVFTYNATSRLGESGSPVIDLDTLDVVGVHYCCTGGNQVDNALECASWHAQNVSWNEAISVSTLIADKNLAGFLEVGPQIVGQLEPQSLYHFRSLLAESLFPVGPEPSRKEEDCQLWPGMLSL